MSSRASSGTAATVLLASLALGFGGGATAGMFAGDNSGTAEQQSTASPSASPSDTGPALTLKAATTAVGPNEQIDMTGALEPPQSGVTFTVQRSLDGGDWAAFPDESDPVTVTTDDDGRFSTYVKTGREGQNGFRVVGTVDGADVASEPVTVTVG
ncbi:MAG: hypothetical protein ICV70_04185 [Jiangellaceae bacterium]|nr:hypothetical protein [Jiangellaceae bacterium]